jgi:ankyrin repeat protein
MRRRSSSRRGGNSEGRRRRNTMHSNVGQQGPSPRRLTGSARIKHGIRRFISDLFACTASFGIVPLIFLAPSFKFFLLGLAGLLLLFICAVVIVPEQEEDIFSLHARRRLQAQGRSQPQQEAQPTPNQPRAALHLNQAAARGNSEMLITLLASGSDVNAKSSEGWTALMLAAEKGHTAIMEILLAEGANTETKSEQGWTALIDAAVAGHWTAIEVLLAAGANTETKSKQGMTALIYAAASGHSKAVEILCQNGANIEAQYTFGRTALHKAALNGHTDVLRALIQLGANKEAIDNKGKTALMLAAEKGHTEAVKILRPPKREREVVLTKDELAHLICVASQNVFDEGFHRKSKITVQELKDLLNAVTAVTTDAKGLAALYDKIMDSHAYRAYFIPDERGTKPIDGMTEHFLPNHHHRSLGKIHLIKHAFKNRSREQVRINRMRNFVYHLASDVEIQEKRQDFNQQNLSLVMFPDLKYKVEKHLRGGNSCVLSGAYYRTCHGTGPAAFKDILEQGGFKEGYRNIHDDTEMVYSALMTNQPETFDLKGNRLRARYRINPNYIRTVKNYAAQKTNHPSGHRFFFFTAKGAEGWENNPHHIRHNSQSTEADYVSFKARKARLRSLLLPDHAVVRMRQIIPLMFSVMFLFI